MAKSLSVHKGFCGIYEKNGHGSFTVLVYKYGEPYKLLDEFYVDTEENIIRDFHANVDFYYDAVSI